MTFIALKDSITSLNTPEQYITTWPSTGYQGFCQWLESPLLLVAIGIFSALSALLVDYTIVQTMYFRSYLASENIVVLFLVSSAFTSTATAVVYFISPFASGSGLPEMKVAISGVTLPQYLSRSCLVAKILGLVFAYSGGLSIGKEGPFIQIACCFTNVMLQLSFFKRLRDDSSKRIEMLACACSAAVACTFGTPFGGVLFAIEVTSTFYMVRNLPRSLFAVIVGSLVIALFDQDVVNFQLFSSTNASNASRGHHLSGVDVVVFGGLGILCGLLGACFTKLIVTLVGFRDQFLTRYHHHPLMTRLTLVTLVTLGTVVLEVVLGRFYPEFFQQSQGTTTQDIISSLLTPSRDLDRDDDDDLKPGQPGHPVVLPLSTLLLLTPVKYVLTAVSVILPLPAGIFTPVFVIGGCLGRVFGEIIMALGLQYEYLPYEFAIVGAAAFSTGVTRAISTAVILLELGHDHAKSLMLPIIVAILAAYYTGAQFQESVYDVLITTHRLPQLKKLPKSVYEFPASELMDLDKRALVVVTDTTTYGQAREMLQRFPEQSLFPIVDDQLLLLAIVRRERLEEAIVSRAAVYHRHGTTYQTTTTTNIDPLDCPIQYCYRQAEEWYHWNNIASSKSGQRMTANQSRSFVMINRAPFQVVETMPLRRVDELFRMLKLRYIYVTQNGKLVGVISRMRLMQFLSTMGKYRQPNFIQMISHNLSPNRKDNQSTPSRCGSSESLI